MSDQTETTETAPRPFAALEKILEMFPGYSLRVAAGDDEDDDVFEQARAIRGFALEQAVQVGKITGNVGLNPDMVTKGILERAAKFDDFINGVDS